MYAIVCRVLVRSILDVGCSIVACTNEKKANTMRKYALVSVAAVVVAVVSDSFSLTPSPPTLSPLSLPISLHII